MLLSLLGAAALPLTLTAAAPTDATTADLRCVAAFAMAGGMEGQTAEARQGITGAFMYYIGRIDARDPNYDLQGQLTRLLGSPGVDQQLQADAKRCGAEMARRGSEITALGQAIENAGNGSAKPAR